MNDQRKLQTTDMGKPTSPEIPATNAAVDEGTDDDDEPGGRRRLWGLPSLPGQKPHVPLVRAGWDPERFSGLDRLQYEINQLIVQCAIYSVTARGNANLRQSDVKAAGGPNPATISKIEGAILGFGPRLGTLGKIALITRTKLVLELHDLSGVGDDTVAPMPFVCDGGNAAALSARIVKQSRSAARLSREQLDARLVALVSRNDRDPKRWKGYTAKVEALSFPNGIKLGRVAEIAFACGFKVAVEFEDRR